MSKFFRQPAFLGLALLLLSWSSQANSALNLLGPDFYLRLAPPTEVLGLVQLILSGAQSGATSTVPVKVLQGPALDIVPLAQETLDVTDGGGFMAMRPIHLTHYRYFRARFRVRNAPACNSPGACPPAPQGRPRYLVNLIPAATGSTLAGTPFLAWTRYDGHPTNPADIPSALPVSDIDDEGRISRRSVWPHYSATELAASPTMAALPGVTKLFGDTVFLATVREGGACTRQERFTLPAIIPDRSEEDGVVTVAYRLPMDGAGATTPTSITVVMAVVESATPPLSPPETGKSDLPWSTCKALL